MVAEIDGRIVGSNFLDERDPIRGVGPITVDPEGQNSGVGRKLMEAVIERGKDAPGIRLAQDGFHMRSLSLYASLGFDVTASCVVMSGKPRDGAGRRRRGPAADRGRPRPSARRSARRCTASSAPGRCATPPARAFTPFAALRDGRIVAYATTVNFWPMAYGVAETEEDMKALLLGAAAASSTSRSRCWCRCSRAFSAGLSSRACGASSR